MELGRTEATKPTVIAGHVYDPLLFSRRLVHFSARQYLFLNAYRLGVSFEEAANKAGFPAQSAERFLRRKDVRAWLEDRARQDYIKNEWSEPSRWWKEGDRVWNGDKDVSREQLEVWKEFGRRIQPPKEGSLSPSTININVHPHKVAQAFEREKAIEAKVESQIKENAA